MTVNSHSVKRNFYKGKCDSIREELSSVEWDTMDEMNVEDSWHFFINKINNSVDRNVPLKKHESEQEEEKMG